MTYPPADGSSYPTGRSASSSKNTTSAYGAESEDQTRTYGGVDPWTAAMLDELTNGKPITTKTVE